MPQRLIGAAGIVLGVLGLLALGLLVLVRADLKRAAATGPRWKRSLVAAGLVLLAAVGMARGQAVNPAPAAAAQPEAGTASPQAAGTAGSAGKAAATQPASRLQETKEWKDLSAAWKDAEEIASGSRGAYPFDAKGKKAIQDALDSAGQALDRFQSAGELSAEEAQVLKIDLKRIQDGVAWKRTTEERMATCYEAIAPGFYEQLALDRIATRLPLLAKVAESGKVKTDVMAKVLPGLEADVAMIERDRQGADANRADAVSAAREQLKKLKATTQPAGAPAKGSAAATAPAPDAAPQPAKALADTPEWKAVLDFWQEAAPLAESHKSTTAQRAAVAEKQKAADSAAGRLAKDGLIAAAEAKLLQSEAARIVDEMLREPPTDMMVKCYDMALMIPAQVSLERLERRQALLSELVKGGKVQPAVWEKVLPAIQADLKTLEDANQTKRLPDDAARQRADKVRRDVEAAVKAIRAREVLERVAFFFDQSDRGADAFGRADPNARATMDMLGAFAASELNEEMIEALPQALQEKARQAVERARKSFPPAFEPTCYALREVKFIPTRPDEEVIAIRKRLLDACLARGAIDEAAYRKVLESLRPGRVV